MKNRSALLTVLFALFKNKLRFDAEKSKAKKIGSLVLLGVAGAVILTVFIVVLKYIGAPLASVGLAPMVYFGILMTSAAFVLVFGLVSLVSTLFLSKDTDFYSMLPIKPSTVFAAKVLFVYLSETAICLFLVLPAAVAFGIIIKLTAWYYYVITIVVLVIVPALPLAVASIFAVPVMFIAGKLKNRSVVPIIFYCILFFGFFGLYFYLIVSMQNLATIELTEAQLQKIANVVNVIGYVFYPYTALSAAVFGAPTYGLGVGASIAVNLLIFLGISAALICILLLLGKFMYGRSARANNQTDNSKAKNGKFRTAGTLKAMMKREYKLAIRSTQVTIQCFIGCIMVILFSVLFGYLYIKMPSATIGEALSDSVYSFFIVLCVVMFVMPVSAQAPMTSFSREGQAIETVKTLPLSPMRVCLSKVSAWAVLAVPSCMIATVIVNAYMFDVGRFFISVLGVMLFIVSYIFFAVAWDLTAPKLKWTDPMQALKHNSHLIIGTAFGMLPSFAGIITVLACMNYGVSAATMAAFVWSELYAASAVFAAVDIVMYRKVSTYYNRIEV